MALLFLSQSSLCAAGGPRSAGVACPRAPSQVAAISGAQTHAGLQECTGTNRQVRSLFTLLVDVDVLVAIIHSLCFLWLILSSLIGCPSSVLTYIFMIDVNLPYTQPTTSPRISDFTERILVQLKPLTEGDEEIQNHVIEENEVGEQDERTQAIKLLKTGRSRMCHLNTVDLI